MTSYMYPLLASPRVNEPYAHQIRASNSRNYRMMIVEIPARRPMEVLHGKFMLGIIMVHISYVTGMQKQSS